VAAARHNFVAAACSSLGNPKNNLSNLWFQHVISGENDGVLLGQKTLWQTKN
jgi:hypothetical protein